MRRVLAIFLDGYEQSLARRFAATGDMPTVARLEEHAACWLLDHGPAQRTGLAGEHFATGLSPDDAQRWAAVDFDPGTYRAWQVGTNMTPFPAALPSTRTVVFDPPYFNLAAAPSVRGLVNWGAHDPGVATSANPPGLQDEFIARFGAYPAKPWIYGFAWSSPERAREMGEALARAVDARTRAARWLLGERLPDWDLAIVTVSEPHSVIEGLYHGVDETHPLHGIPSAIPAGEGVRAVYGAVDRLISELAAAFPDAVTVVFSMGGMGPNRSDAASMLLLPELLYRNTYGQPLFNPMPAGAAGPEGVPPLLPPDLSFDRWAQGGYTRTPKKSVLARFIERASERVAPGGPARSSGTLVSDLDWMAARAYQPYWSSMPAFALPSFYDGRVRINLTGRESKGRVPLESYAATVRAVEELLHECVDARTREPVVDFFEYPHSRNPLAVGPTESDLVVVWKGMPLGLEHPRLGRIGPVPFRRTGGHTGPHGIAYVAGAGITSGQRGVASSFDVVPTILDLLGVSIEKLSGRSLLRGH